MKKTLLISFLVVCVLPCAIAANNRINRPQKITLPIKTIGLSIDSISPNSGQPGAIVTIKGAGLDFIQAVYLSIKRWGRQGNIPLEIINKPSNSEWDIRIPSDQKIKEFINGLIFPLPASVFKAEITPETFIAGPADITFAPNQKIPFTLVGIDGQTGIRNARISSVSPDTASLGSKINITGDDLDLISEAAVKLKAAGDILFACRIIGTPKKSGIEIILPTEKEIREIYHFLPADADLNGPAEIYLRYLADSSKMGLNWSSGFGFKLSSDI